VDCNVTIFIYTDPFELVGQNLDVAEKHTFMLTDVSTAMGREQHYEYCPKFVSRANYEWLLQAHRG